MQKPGVYFGGAFCFSTGIVHHVTTWNMDDITF